MVHRRHPRAKLTVQGRLLLVQRVRERGWPAVRAAEAQGVSRATAYKWLARYDAEGEPGLQDRSPRPGSCRQRLSPAREAAILARRQALLEGPHRIGWALGEARSTVYRVLRRHGMPRLGDLDRATRQVVRYQRQRPGELVHVDVKKLGRVPDGGGWWAHGRQQRPNRHRGQGYDFLHVAVDDRSRVADAEAHLDERQATAAGFIGRAVRWFADHGITVERVLTDNGNCYRSQAIEQALTELGVTQRFCRPYRPQTNGKVERFNLTLKLEWAYATVYASNQARLDHLAWWLHHYNHHRPHTAHQAAAPMTAVNDLPAKHS